MFIDFLYENNKFVNERKLKSQKCKCLRIRKLTCPKQPLCCDKFHSQLPQIWVCSPNITHCHPCLASIRIVFFFLFCFGEVLLIRIRSFRAVRVLCCLFYKTIQLIFVHSPFQTFQTFCLKCIEVILIRCNKIF